VPYRIFVVCGMPIGLVPSVLFDALCYLHLALTAFAKLSSSLSLGRNPEGRIRFIYSQASPKIPPLQRRPCSLSTKSVAGHHENPVIYKQIIRLKLLHRPPPRIHHLIGDRPGAALALGLVACVGTEWGRSLPHMCRCWTGPGQLHFWRFLLNGSSNFCSALKD
jgi:hypothetical protein